MHRSIRFAFLVIPFGVVSCAAASSDYMKPLTPAPTATAAADTSLVTFVRHDGAKGILYTIMDDQKQFVGQIAVNSRFNATYPPGEHVFVAWNDAEQTTGAATFGLIGAAISAASGELPHVEPLRATLAPGKAYLVEVGSDGKWHLLPGSGAALADTTAYAPDAAGGQAFFAKSPDRIEGIRTKALDQLHGYGQADLAAHTLRAEDGR